MKGEKFKELIQSFSIEFLFSIRRQIAAIDKLHERGMYFFDYGNAFLLTAKRAGKTKTQCSIDIDCLNLMFQVLRLVAPMIHVVFDLNIRRMFKILWAIFFHWVSVHFGK